MPAYGILGHETCQAVLTRERAIYEFVSERASKTKVLSTADSRLAPLLIPMSQACWKYSQNPIAP